MLLPRLFRWLASNKIDGEPGASRAEPLAFSSPLSPSRPGRVWIDVGAHLGEKTLQHARADPQLRIYGFEPTLEVAMQLATAAPNFTVLPMAVSEADGIVDFYLNTCDAASSILPFDEGGLAGWNSPDALRVAERRSVPSIRLDTFLNRLGIPEVEFLKIDAQGADLAVVRSAGARLKDIQRLTLEVQVTERSLYAGSSRKEEIVSYLENAGFKLAHSERQSLDQEENLTFVNSRFGGGA